MLLLDDEDIPHPNIECLFTTQEEIGMYGARDFNYSDIEASYLINLDGEEENIDGTIDSISQKFLDFSHIFSSSAFFADFLLFKNLRFSFKTDSHRFKICNFRSKRVHTARSEHTRSPLAQGRLLCFYALYGTMNTPFPAETVSLHLPFLTSSNVAFPSLYTTTLSQSINSISTVFDLP